MLLHQQSEEQQQPGVLILHCQCQGAGAGGWLRLGAGDRVFLLWEGVLATASLAPGCYWVQGLCCAGSRD